MRAAGKWFLGFVVASLVLVTPRQASAQEFRGRIVGTVTDSSGAVLPGVSVTASSAALIQAQVAVTGEDGVYRLVALPPGVYELTFELAGFQSLTRTAVRVLTNTTLTVNAELHVATVRETVTVSNEPPLIDTSTTTVGTNLTKELLTAIPNARDIWAAMAQAPGFHMMGYDVGGSHTGNQTGYLIYGVGDQRTMRIEGVNTTDNTRFAGGFFDFGSFEEFQLGASGNMADHDTPGGSLNITVKSGGDRFSGTWHSDWESDGTISDNVPGAFKTASTRDGNGFFVRRPLTRGNPVDRQYDINADIGGPLWKRRAWFFYSYRLNEQYKHILNFDELEQTKLVNPFAFKTTFQLSSNNQLIGYVDRREKLQPLRDLGPNVPVSAAYFQSSTTHSMKIEWTRVLNDRMFLDVLLGRWLQHFPLRPTTESGAFSGPYVPGRVDLGTMARLSGGPNTAYQDQKQFKPQFSAWLSYFKEGWQGSHGFKVGIEGRRHRRRFVADQPFDLVYYDARLGVTPQEVEFYNTPNESTNQVNALSGYVNDSWRISRRLTFNLGVRVDYYKDGYPEQTVTPNGVPVLGTISDPRLIELFAPRTIPGAWVSRSTTVSPRAGLAYDLKGNGKSVIKGFYGRFSFMSAPETIAATANSVGRTRLRYSWTDRNGNLLLDGPEELGNFLRSPSDPLRANAGQAGIKIDQDLERPYGQELSMHFEQEMRTGLSGRMSYVYKNFRNEWAIVDISRITAYTTPFRASDRGPDGQLSTGDDGPLVDVRDRTSAPEELIFTNPRDPRYDSDYHTIELAVNRRLLGRWMLMTSFEHTWLNELYGSSSNVSALGSAGNNKEYDWRPNVRRFGREQATIWNYKLIGRYLLPRQFGLSGSYKLQSGRHWGRALTVFLPVAGSETIRVEPMTANRAPHVAITDVRFDKTFRLSRPRGRLTAMLDVFNVFNHGTVTAFRTTTAANGSFKEVTALLDPRIVRLGVRYEF